MTTTTGAPERTDADRARDLLDLVSPADLDQTGLILLAQTHATLAYVHAAEQLHTAIEATIELAAGALIDATAAIDRAAETGDRLTGAVDGLTAAIDAMAKPKPFPLCALFSVLAFAGAVAMIVIVFAAGVL